MNERISRRAAIRQIGAAGAGVLLAGGRIAGQTSDVRIAGRRVEVRIWSLSPSTVRIAVLPIEEPNVAAVPDLGILARPESGKPAAAGRAPGALRSVRAGDLVVRYTDSPPAIEVQARDGAVVQRLSLNPDAPGMSFLLPKGPLLGLGQGGPQFDRKGSEDRMRSGQGGYQLRTHGARAPIQWLVGTDGWGMFVHHPLGAFDFTGAEGRFTPAADALPLDVFVVASRDPQAIMGEYARITGHPELPARWTLGYMQSHRTLAGPEEIMSVARTFREKQLPCDALIYLGTEFTPSGWNTRNGEFTWHAGNFPDPKGMIDALHERHFKVVLHIVIEGRRLSETVHEPCDPKNAVPSGRRGPSGLRGGRWRCGSDTGCQGARHRSRSEPRTATSSSSTAERSRWPGRRG